MKTYWIDADVDGTPRINDWRAKNKSDAIEQAKAYYQSLGVPLMEIIIRQVTVK